MYIQQSSVLNDIAEALGGSKKKTRINQIHRLIKFTYKLNETELTFLDVTLYKGETLNHNHILDIHAHIKTTNKQLSCNLILSTNHN